MSLWYCDDCTTAYSVGAPRCPNCGGRRRTDDRVTPAEGGAPTARRPRIPAPRPPLPGGDV